MRRVAAAFALLALWPATASAWPAPVLESLVRDARRLLPSSLARLMHDREAAMLEELRRFPPEIGTALAADQVRGRLSPETLALVDQRASAVTALLREGKVKPGIDAMAGLVRVPADLADPALSSPDAYPPGVLVEYYTFVENNLEKIPVVLSDPPALQLDRGRLPAYWQKQLDTSRAYSGVIRTELFQRGKVVSHRAIDYRNPVFGVASLSYSRAVTAIAATWLAVWRESRGDLTARPQPQLVVPRPGAGPRIAEAP